MVSTTENLESVQELVLSQESQTGTHQSVREVARETDRDNRCHQVSVFRHNIGNCDFQFSNSTINNSIDISKFFD